MGSLHKNFMRVVDAFSRLTTLAFSGLVPSVSEGRGRRNAGLCSGRTVAERCEPFERSRLHLFDEAVLPVHVRFHIVGMRLC